MSSCPNPWQTRNKLLVDFRTRQAQQSLSEWGCRAKDSPNFSPKRAIHLRSHLEHNAFRPSKDVNRRGLDGTGLTDSHASTACRQVLLNDKARSLEFLPCRTQRRFVVKLMSVSLRLISSEARMPVLINTRRIARPRTLDIS